MWQAGAWLQPKDPFQPRVQLSASLQEVRASATGMGWVRAPVSPPATPMRFLGCFRCYSRQGAMGSLNGCLQWGEVEEVSASLRLVETPGHPKSPPHLEQSHSRRLRTCSSGAATACRDGGPPASRQTPSVQEHTKGSQDADHYSCQPRWCLSCPWPKVPFYFFLSFYFLPKNPTLFHSTWKFLLGRGCFPKLLIFKHATENVQAETGKKRKSASCRD